MAARDAEEGGLRRTVDRRRLEAQVASDRYLDPPTGLPRLLPDPAAVDRTVFHEIVVDAAIMAGAVGEADDVALAWGLVATAARHGLLTTADGVDNRARLQTAASMRVRHVQGAVFGPMHSLLGALDVWPVDADLRDDDGQGDDDLAPPRALARSMTLELGQWAAGLEDGDGRLREQVRSWLDDDAVTPAHVRRLLAADHRSRSWSLPEVSLLIALAAT